MEKCKKGYRRKNGRCVRVVRKRINSKQPLFGLLPGQRLGLFLIAFSIFIWYIRPAQQCQWWQILCLVGGLAISPIYFIASILLLIGGVIYLLKLDKIIFSVLRGDVS